MNGASISMRVWLFLYSTRNLAGSVLALAGLALFFNGVIDHWWFGIVAGLYATGFIAVPGGPELASPTPQNPGEVDLAEQVAQFVADNATALPAEALQRLHQMRALVTALAPRLTEDGMAFEHAITLTNAVTRDLPETLHNYRRLPVVFANVHIVENGKTCKQLLIEQLDLLNAQLVRIADNVYRDDADALLANGRFLREKFHSLAFGS